METPRASKILQRSDIESYINTWLTPTKSIWFHDPGRGGQGDLSIPEGVPFKITNFDIHLNRLNIEIENGVKSSVGTGCFPHDGIEIEE